MTSTNDENEVKRSQKISQKRKSYFIELYKSLDAALSADCTLRERTGVLCNAWSQVHRFCTHAAPSTHPHLLQWLQKHTALTVLRSEWQELSSSALQPIHQLLRQALESFIEEVEVAVKGHGSIEPWEATLQSRAKWFIGFIQDPWGHVVLRRLLNPGAGPPCGNDEIIQWLKEESGIVFVSRLIQLAASKRTNDLALSLVTVVMDRKRSGDVKDKINDSGGTVSFGDQLSQEAGFTSDVWETLTDIEYVLLHRLDKTSKCIQLAKMTPLRNSYTLIDRLRFRLDTSPADKKLWKNSKDVALLIAEVIVTRCMVCEWGDSVGATLYRAACVVAHLVPATVRRTTAAALAAPAVSAKHLHTLAAAMETQCSEDMKAFVVELYVRAITAGMNELEKLKLNNDKEIESRVHSRTISQWFVQLSCVVGASQRLAAECTLTAFSVYASPHLYERIKAQPNFPPPLKPQDTSSNTPSSSFGSWANDSRSQTNLVKTSETLKLTFLSGQTSVLSTAILNEGENIGLQPELCQDLAVLLSGPRVKTLTWDMDREKLLDNCRAYMERTHCGTRSLKTELKYLNLDPAQYQHLPLEEDDEDDVYYGIEKGYEHLIEVKSPEPEKIWTDLHDETNSSTDTDVEFTRRRNKKLALSSDDDNDPLSLTADIKSSKNRKGKKNNRSRSKERSRSEENKTARKEKKERQKRDNNDTKKSASLAKLNEIHEQKQIKSTLVKPNVTDSDYYSQGKSSLASLTSLETCEENVVFDGLFSMEDLNITSPKDKAVTHNIVEAVDKSLKNTKTKDLKVKNETAKTKQSKPKSELTPKQFKHNAIPKISCKTQPIINEKVRNNINKLLQFRKQKNSASKISMIHVGESKDLNQNTGSNIVQDDKVLSKCETQIAKANERNEKHNLNTSIPVENVAKLTSPTNQSQVQEKLQYNSTVIKDTQMSEVTLKQKPLNIQNNYVSLPKGATVAEYLKELKKTKTMPKPNEKLLEQTRRNDLLYQQQQLNKLEQQHRMLQQQSNMQLQPSVNRQETPTKPLFNRPDTPAKPLLKKADTVLNTFARLSYLHKNKQMEPRKVEQTELESHPNMLVKKSDQSQMESFSDELERRISAYKHYKYNSQRTTTPNNSPKITPEQKTNNPTHIASSETQSAVKSTESNIMLRSLLTPIQNQQISSLTPNQLNQHNKDSSPNLPLQNVQSDMRTDCTAIHSPQSSILNKSNKSNVSNQLYQNQTNKFKHPYQSVYSHQNKEYYAKLLSGDYLDKLSKLPQTSKVGAKTETISNQNCSFKVPTQNSTFIPSKTNNQRTQTSNSGFITTKETFPTPMQQNEGTLLSHIKRVVPQPAPRNPQSAMSDEIVTDIIKNFRSKHSKNVTIQACTNYTPSNAKAHNQVSTVPGKELFKKTVQSNDGRLISNVRADSPQLLPDELVTDIVKNFKANKQLKSSKTNSQLKTSPSVIQSLMTQNNSKSVLTAKNPTQIIITPNKRSVNSNNTAIVSQCKSNNTQVSKAQTFTKSVPSAKDLTPTPITSKKVKSTATVVKQSRKKTKPPQTNSSTIDNAESLSEKSTKDLANTYEAYLGQETFGEEKLPKNINVYVKKDISVLTEPSYVSKNLLPDKKPQDWESVMNAILAAKTNKNNDLMNKKTLKEEMLSTDTKKPKVTQPEVNNAIFKLPLNKSKTQIEVKSNRTKQKNSQTCAKTPSSLVSEAFDDYALIDELIDEDLLQEINSSDIEKSASIDKYDTSLKDSDSAFSAQNKCFERNNVVQNYITTNSGPNSMQQYLPNTTHYNSVGDPNILIATVPIPKKVVLVTPNVVTQNVVFDPYTTVIQEAQIRNVIGSTYLVNNTQNVIYKTQYVAPIVSPVLVSSAVLSQATLTNHTTTSMVTATPIKKDVVISNLDQNDSNLQTAILRREATTQQSPDRNCINTKVAKLKNTKNVTSLSNRNKLSNQTDATPVSCVSSIAFNSAVNMQLSHLIGQTVNKPEINCFNNNEVQKPKKEINTSGKSSLSEYAGSKNKDTEQTCKVIHNINEEQFRNSNIKSKSDVIQNSTTSPLDKNGSKNIQSRQNCVKLDLDSQAVENNVVKVQHNHKTSMNDAVKNALNQLKREDGISKKRNRILNRKIHRKSRSKAIALGYEPLRKYYSPKQNKDADITDMERMISEIEKSNKQKINKINAKVTSPCKQDTIKYQKSNLEANCRRILLRSSNKIKSNNTETKTCYDNLIKEQKSDQKHETPRDNSETTNEPIESNKGPEKKIYPNTNSLQTRDYGTLPTKSSASFNVYKSSNIYIPNDTATENKPKKSHCKKEIDQTKASEIDINNSEIRRSLEKEKQEQLHFITEQTKCLQTHDTEKIPSQLNTKNETESAILDIPLLLECTEEPFNHNFGIKNFEASIKSKTSITSPKLITPSVNKQGHSDIKDENKEQTTSMDVSTPSVPEISDLNKIVNTKQPTKCIDSETLIQSSVTKQSHSYGNDKIKEKITCIDKNNLEDNLNKEENKIPNLKDFTISNVQTVKSKDGNIIRQCITLQISNHRSLRVTVHGSYDLNNLLNNPEIRAAIGSSLRESKSVTLNFKPIVNSKEVYGIGQVKEKKPVETIDLLSDEDEKPPSEPQRAKTSNLNSTNYQSGKSPLEVLSSSLKCKTDLINKSNDKLHNNIKIHHKNKTGPLDYVFNDTNKFNKVTEVIETIKKNKHDIVRHKHKPLNKISLDEMNNETCAATTNTLSNDRLLQDVETKNNNSIKKDKQTKIKEIANKDLTVSISSDNYLVEKNQSKPCRENSITPDIEDLIQSEVGEKIANDKKAPLKKYDLNYREEVVTPDIDIMNLNLTHEIKASQSCRENSITPDLEDLLQSKADNGPILDKKVSLSKSDISDIQKSVTSGRNITYLNRSLKLNDDDKDTAYGSGKENSITPNKENLTQSKARKIIIKDEVQLDKLDISSEEVTPVVELINSYAQKMKTSQGNYAVTPNNDITSTKKESAKCSVIKVPKKQSKQKFKSKIMQNKIKPTSGFPSTDIIKESMQSFVKMENNLLPIFIDTSFKMPKVSSKVAFISNDIIKKVVNSNIHLGNSKTKSIDNCIKTEDSLEVIDIIDSSSDDELISKGNTSNTMKNNITDNTPFAKPTHIIEDLKNKRLDKIGTNMSNKAAPVVIDSKFSENCLIRLTRCDKLAQNYSSVRSDCYIKLYRCDNLAAQLLRSQQCFNKFFESSTEDLRSESPSILEHNLELIEADKYYTLDSDKSPNSPVINAFELMAESDCKVMDTLVVKIDCAGEWFYDKRITRALANDVNLISKTHSSISNICVTDVIRADYSSNIEVPTLANITLNYLLSNNVMDHLLSTYANQSTVKRSLKRKSENHKVFKLDNEAAKRFKSEINLHIAIVSKVNTVICDKQNQNTKTSVSNINEDNNFVSNTKSITRSDKIVADSILANTLPVKINKIVNLNLTALNKTEDLPENVEEIAPDIPIDDQPVKCSIEPNLTRVLNTKCVTYLPLQSLINHRFQTDNTDPLCKDFKDSNKINIDTSIDTKKCHANPSKVGSNINQIETIYKSLSQQITCLNEHENEHVGESNKEFDKTKNDGKMIPRLKCSGTSKDVNLNCGQNSKFTLNTYDAGEETNTDNTFRTQKSNEPEENKMCNHLKSINASEENKDQENNKSNDSTVTKDSNDCPKILVTNAQENAKEISNPDIYNEYIRQNNKDKSDCIFKPSMVSSLSNECRDTVSSQVSETKKYTDLEILNNKSKSIDILKQSSLLKSVDVPLMISSHVAQTDYYIDDEDPNVESIADDILSQSSMASPMSIDSQTIMSSPFSADSCSTKEFFLDINEAAKLPTPECTTPIDEKPGIVIPGIEVEHPVMGTCYIFRPVYSPSDDSVSHCSEIDSAQEKLTEHDTIKSSKTDGYQEVYEVLEIIEECDSSKEIVHPNEEIILKVPTKTYASNLNISRKRPLCMKDIKVTEKKYRKGKNIDYPKMTQATINKFTYRNDYQRVIDYIDKVKFSYARPFHKEYIDVEEIMQRWPLNSKITNGNLGKTTEINKALFSEEIFTDQKAVVQYSTLNEDIESDYLKTEIPNIEETEHNFSMGFGERSDRVIQNLNVRDNLTISAATLSDVKQYQPSQCENLTDIRKRIKSVQNKLLHQIMLNKVKIFFDNYKIIYTNNHNIFPNVPGLNDTSCIRPAINPQIVNVVQLGQLPVSATAQNPVTCDPRVTQVSDASPSQCSVESSPRSDNNQANIKAEYTELTTADLSMPMIQNMTHQNLIPNDVKDNAKVTEQNVIPTHVETETKIITDECNAKMNKNNSSPDLSVNNIEYKYDETNGNNANTSPETHLVDSTQKTLNTNAQIKETDNSQKPENGPEKTDQIAYAMNAAGITTSEEPETTRSQSFVNIISQKVVRPTLNNVSVNNSYSKTPAINAISLQQALAQILPPPLNQTNNAEGNTPQNVTPQVLHIVHGKNASGNQITLLDNSQQSVLAGSSATQLLHIVQNKGAVASTQNNVNSPQQATFSGISLVDAGLQQGGNQLLHIVNTGTQKNNNAGQLIKRVNLLTNLANAQGGNEQKMVQFVCKSADGKSLQLNAPHQRSMVLRLQPIETPVQLPTSKTNDQQNKIQSQNTNTHTPNKDDSQEIKSRSIYEENYAKFIQTASAKPVNSVIGEKLASLPKFNQAFGKPVFQDEAQKQNDLNIPSIQSTENNECRTAENSINLDHITQIGSPPLLLRKQPLATSQAQQTLVQQIKQTIAPMNIQTMHGGVIYTRQIPVNLGGGQTINLITVPSTEMVDDSGQKQPSEVKFVTQTEGEPSIIKIVPQTPVPNAEVSQEDGTAHMVTSEGQPQPQPVLTQMRIKLPMLSKGAQAAPGARIVRPSFFQIQRNVIGGANQPVYQQLVLTAAPPLGQQSIRLPQTQTRLVKGPNETQTSESQLSSSTLEQLREFDMVLEQVKERSTVQPGASPSYSKSHSTDTTDGASSSSSNHSEQPQQILYSIGNNQTMNIAYINKKATITTSTANFVRSPDSSVADSPSSSQPGQVTSETSSSGDSQTKPARFGSKSMKSRLTKPATHTPSAVKVNNNIPPKTSTQKPLEDEQTTQRILYILAEYKEQVENSPDKDKPAPRRRTNVPSNPSGSSKRKKSGSRRSGCTRDHSPITGDDACRTMGSEDSSCGTSQGDCTESCGMETHSPQDSPRKVARKLFEPETPTVTQPRPQPQRNLIVADGQTITVARSATGKPATAVLMPANYILPVSMVKGGQQIAIVTNRGPKLLTVGGTSEGGAANALFLQRLIGPAGLKPVLTRPGVRHVRLPTAALHNLQAFNLATTVPAQQADSTASSSAPTPDLVETKSSNSPWTEADASSDVKLERSSSPEGSEPWNLPASSDQQNFSYEEATNARQNADRTVLDSIQDRYSPDVESQRIFDKMFEVDKKFIVEGHDDLDASHSDCDDKVYNQVVQKKDGSTHSLHRVAHISAAALRHKYAILEHELRLQKSLSEECEDLGVDSPSASDLFPEADLLFAASPAHDHDAAHHNQNTAQPSIHQSQSEPEQPELQQQLLHSSEEHGLPDVGLALGEDGVVTVSEDGLQALALDQEEFARSHPNTTFHSEPTDEVEVQPFSISTAVKPRHITSAIYHTGAPATVLMATPQTVISHPSAETSQTIKYSDIDNIIIPGQNNRDIHLSSVLVKDDGLTRYDNILTDSRELHLSNTASAIVHPGGNATQVIRRVCYEDDKRDRFLMDDTEIIAGKDAKMAVAEDSSRDATLGSIEVDDNASSPERHAELFWESNSASIESRRPLDFSSDSDKCCKSPSFDETNSTDSSGLGTHMRLDSVIKEARVRERSGSACSSADDTIHPPIRTYPPKRSFHNEEERSMSGKTRAGEASPDCPEVRRRASNRGVVKRGCHCCNGSPAPQRPKKQRQRKPTLDFTTNN